MKQKILRIILALLIVTAIIAPLIGVNTVSADATYNRIMQFTVKDTSGTNRTNVQVLLSGLDVNYLITSGYLTLQAFDSDIQDITDSISMIYMVSSNQIIMVIPVLNAYDTNTYYLLMGYSSPKTKYPIVMGGGGYATITDAAALEPAGNFAFEFSATYVDTTSGTGKYLLNKAGAITVDSGVTTAGKITAKILNTLEYASPISSSYDGTWTNEANAYDGDTGTRATAGFSTPGSSGYLNLNIASTYCDRYRFWAGVSAPSVISIEISLYYDGQWNIEYNGIPSWDEYITDTLSEFEYVTAARVRFSTGNSLGASNGYVYEFGFGYQGAGTNLVTETVATGEHDIKVYCDGTNFKLDIDGENVDSVVLSGTVTDQTSNWLLNQNNAAIYMGSFTETVSGTEVIKYEPAAMPVSTITTYNTGTATFTNNSPTVSGSGTTFTSSMIGGMIKDNADGTYYTIDSVGGAESLTLSSNYLGTTDTGVTYTIYYGLSATLIDLDTADGTQNATITGGINTDLIIEYETISIAPAITTINPSNITPESVVMQCSLGGLGSATSALIDFEYGLDTSYGQLSSPQAVSSLGSYYVQVTGLIFGTTYHYRAHLSVGGVDYYGSDISFSTLPAAGSSTVIKIDHGRVFEDYLSSGDLLFCVEYSNTYTDYYPSENPKTCFTIQLIDTDTTTVLASTPLTQWGYRPASIYLSPTTASSLTIGSAYYLRMQGLGSLSSVVTDYELTSTNWQGSDMDNLYDWCKQTAMTMGAYEKTNINYYVTPVNNDKGLIINDNGGGYFTLGISGISRVLPELFETSESKAQYTAGVDGNTFDVNGFASQDLAWESAVGATIATDFNTWGDFFNMSGRNLMGIFLAGLAILLAICSMAFGTKILGALLISSLVLLWGNQLRCIPIGYTAGLLGGFAVIMFVRQFFFKST